MKKKKKHKWKYRINIKKKILALVILGVSLFVGLGYAIINTSLSITGLLEIGQPFITVTYNADGGTISTASKRYIRGTTYGNITSPTRPGYDFLGWNGKNLVNMEEWLDSFSTAVRGTVVKGTNSVELTATGDDAYTSTYGVANDYRVTVKPNTTYTLSWSSDNDNNGLIYVFMNDSTASGYGKYRDQHDAKTLTFTTLSDVSFITFRVGVANSGESITYSNIQLEEGSTATAYEPYYIASDTTITIKSDHTLTAKWKETEYTISFNANGGSGGQSQDVTVTYGSNMPTISTTAPTRAGYEFVGWYDAATGGTRYYTDAGVGVKNWDKYEDTTLYAHWFRWVLPSGRTPTTLQVGDEIILEGDTAESFYFIRYDESGDAVLLAKYNLKVGHISDHNENITYTYSESDPGYGLQSSEMIGYVSSGADRYGTVYFSRDSYSANSYPADYYDPTVNGDVNSGNYSLAYYVEPYREKLISYGAHIKESRLLKYSEVTSASIGCDDSAGTCPTSTFITSTSYWIGAIKNNYCAYSIETDGRFGVIAYYYDYASLHGVRPVIIVETSELQ